MIIVDKLYKGFEGTQVLKGISTTFEPGKTSLIIGQSGSGKTVFLKSLIGGFLELFLYLILFLQRSILLLQRNNIILRNIIHIPIT